MTRSARPIWRGRRTEVGGGNNNAWNPRNCFHPASSRIAPQWRL